MPYRPGVNALSFVDVELKGLKPRFAPSAALRRWVADWADEHYAQLWYRRPKVTPADIETVALGYMEVASAFTRDERDLELVAHYVMKQAADLTEHEQSHSDVRQGLALGIKPFAEAMARDGRRMLNELRENPDTPARSNSASPWLSLRKNWETLDLVR
jgi:hypothetical protein